MFEKELLEEDVLNRICWDKKINPSDFTVRYIDRFSSKLKEVRYVDIVLESDSIVVGDSHIPLHRIREVRENGKVVWAKRRRPLGR